MKFPIHSCIATECLTKDDYSTLICKLVTDGYLNMLSHLPFDLMQMWDYIGVDGYECIQTYNQPHSFLQPNAWLDYINVPDKDYPNILTKDQLREYLK